MSSCTSTERRFGHSLAHRRWVRVTRYSFPRSAWECFFGRSAALQWADLQRAVGATLHVTKFLIELSDSKDVEHVFATVFGVADQFLALQVDDPIK